MVGTKAFLISIIMMPILMLGSILAMSIFQNMGEVTDPEDGLVWRWKKYNESTG